MNIRAPKLRKHATGQYFVRWGGKDHYLGRDHSDAHEKYLDQLNQWSQWRSQRNARRLPPMQKAIYVAEIAKHFLRTKELEGGIDRRRYYDKHLSRFLRPFGDVRSELIRPVHIQHLKDELLNAGYAPKTINHDIGAVKSMLDWAAAMEYLQPVSFKAIKKLPLGPPPDKSLPFKTVKTMIKKAPNKVRPWLALNYLCLMRPSEVIRVVLKQGTWIEEGVYRIKGKMDHRTTLPRHVCFSEEALGWLDKADPVWSRLDSYSQAVRKSCPHGPGRLRHSAATHLTKLESPPPRADIDLLLGHVPPRVSVTYAHIAWQPLRAMAARLTLE